MRNKQAGNDIISPEAWSAVIEWAVTARTIKAICDQKIPITVEFTGSVGDRGKPEWKASLHSGYYMIRKIDRDYYGVTIHEAVREAGIGAYSILQAIKKGTYYE